VAELALAKKLLLAHAVFGRIGLEATGHGNSRRVSVVSIVRRTAPAAMPLSI
jgi:hypothetical protein